MTLRQLFVELNPTVKIHLIRYAEFSRVVRLRYLSSLRIFIILLKEPEFGVLKESCTVFNK